ncbi:hypothetical protein QUB12_21165 [Microcoleus sp. B7-D4]
MQNLLAAQLARKLTSASAVDSEPKNAIEDKPIPVQVAAEVLRSIVKVW